MASRAFHGAQGEGQASHELAFDPNHHGGFPQIRGTLFGVPIIGITVFGILYIQFPTLGKHHVSHPFWNEASPLGHHAISATCIT